MKLKEITDLMEEWAPLYYQEEWDNSGLQLGDLDDEITGVLVSLDLTAKVIDYAIKEGCNLIINHHPLIFSPIKSLRTDNFKENLIIKAVKNNINVYAAHTNLDVAKGGVNDCLNNKLELNLDGILEENSEDYGLGKYGQIAETSLKKLAENISKKLGENVIYYGDDEMLVSRIALVGGSGSSTIDSAIEKDCQVLITGDIKHHDYMDALERNLAIIDPGHFASEVIICEEIARYLSEKDITNVKVFPEKNQRKIV